MSAMGEAAPHVLIVEARFYADIADELVAGATAVFDAAGVTYERAEVPGALEIPAAVKFAVRSLDFHGARRRYDGYVVLGCVIRGETSHYDIVAGESARKLMDLAVDYTLALGNGVLTCETREQAWERAARDRKDKGGDAARACLAMLGLKSGFHLYPR